MITFTDAVTKAFRQYAVFSGRATRAEFWWWILFLTVAGIILGILDAVIDRATATDYGILTGLFSLATILPGLAVTCRRLHDIGKTGWWQLAWHIFPLLAWLATAIAFVVATVLTISADQTDRGALSFIPFFVALLAATATSLAVIGWAIIWMIRPSQPWANRYGPDPTSAEQSPAP